MGIETENERRDREARWAEMDRLLRPFVENIRRYGEIYPGAIQDAIQAEIRRQEEENS